ncbi:MAG TPA: hypothetical protein VFE58_02425, partial [Tepidisphaeraceae bacterium]|nr:hypothetical protein [Tepidisphaeraceae bacterium]
MAVALEQRSKSVLRQACLLEELEGRRLYSTGMWEIHGDLRPKNKSDVIDVSLSPNDPTIVQATVNGTMIGTRLLANLGTIRVLAGAGNDVVTVNLGDQMTAVKVIVLGGSGSDSITVTGAAAQEIGGPGDDTLVGGAGN